MTTTIQSRTFAVTNVKYWAAAMALVFGLGLVYMTGLSSASVMHNAAHDTRHSMAFPCH